MICPNCDKYFNEDYSFCPYCGTKKPDPLLCPKCKYESYDYTYCPHCGEKLINKTKFKDSNRKNQLKDYLYNSNAIEFLNTEKYLSEIDNGIITDIDELERIIDEDLTQQDLIAEVKSKKLGRNHENILILDIKTRKITDFYTLDEKIEELKLNEEKELIKKIEENRKNWKINQLKELDLGYEELEKLINKEIEKIELQIDRELEDEDIKKNKKLSLKPDEIDEIKFLKKLPSIENRLNAICINPGSNPCIFIRHLKETEILEIIISNGELFLLGIEDIEHILYYFRDDCIDNDLNRGKYFEDTGEYEFDYIDSYFDLDPITGSCILYAETDIDEMEKELSEFYPTYKAYIKWEEEERKKRDEERRKELEKKVDKIEFLEYVEDNADRYIKYLGIDGYYDFTTKIYNDEIPNKKTFYEIEENIEKQIRDGTYKKVKELTEEEILEIKKKGLYCYIRQLHILADGSSVNKPVRQKLMLLVSNGKLLTESQIDIAKERLIKIELAKLKKNF